MCIWRVRLWPKNDWNKKETVNESATRTQWFCVSFLVCFEENRHFCLRRLPENAISNQHRPSIVTNLSIQNLEWIYVNEIVRIVCHKEIYSFCLKFFVSFCSMMKVYSSRLEYIDMLKRKVKHFTFDFSWLRANVSVIHQDRCALNHSKA